MNISQLALAMRVSANTVGKWIAAGMPVLEAGKNGQEYRLRLSDCYAWKAYGDATRAAEKAAGDRAAQQMQLAFANITPRGRAHRFTPAEQKQILLAAREWMEVSRLRGELVDFGEVVELLEAVLGEIRSALDALPDKIARELGLEGAATERVVRQCDGILERAVGELEKYIAENTIDAEAVEASGQVAMAL